MQAMHWTCHHNVTIPCHARSYLESRGAFGESSATRYHAVATIAHRMVSTELRGWSLRAIACGMSITVGLIMASVSEEFYGESGEA